MATTDASEFRTLLEVERKRIADAIAYLHEDNPRNMEDELGEIAGRGSDNHLGDMASVTFDRELDEGLEEGAQQTLAQIDRALSRLDDGSYGTCERCGKEIPAERLHARPWATLCIDDQRLADRG
ncbi:MAG TPA: TraR/DksA C4-type zinc finger protein [Gaiellaceae bacterium]|jgi:RNA polymerase-binding protein DksA